MKRSVKLILIIAIIIVLVLGIGIGAFMIKKYTPGTERADLYSYFNTTVEDEVLYPTIVMQDEIIEAKAFLSEGNYYLGLDVIKEYINEKFYWDSNEEVLIITTANEVTKVLPDSSIYYVDGAKQEFDKQIIKIDSNGTVYIDVAFVKMYSEMNYIISESPNRIWIQNKWGETNLATVDEDSQIRYRAGVKSEILTDVFEGETLYIIEEEGSWRKVYTENGFIGYIKNSKLKDKRTEELSAEYAEQEYENISIGPEINLAWHAIYGDGAEDNGEMVDLVSDTQGLDVISPTWFYLTNSTGTVASMADAAYVSKAHSLGLDVWGTIQDFNKDSDGNLYIDSVLPYTSKREKLEDDLIGLALQYNLEGISINFEQFSSENGENYIQFLREMSIKCREKGLVLSSVNYVAVAWRDYYHREEQGELLDYFIVMAYPEHDGVDGEAGPECSLPYLKESTENILKEVEVAKLIMAVPFYSARWSEEDTLKRSSRTMRRVASDLSLVGATKTWQEDVGMNYAEYTQNGISYKIWIEDAASIEEKVKLLSEYNIAGIAYWALGQETEDVWDSIIKYND